MNETFTPDPGEVRANEEMLQREREAREALEEEQDRQQILEEKARQDKLRDLEENPPLENLEWSEPPPKSENVLLKALGYVGDRFEDLDRAVLGSVGTEDYNLYKARRGTIDLLSEKHFVLGMLGEMFIPDTVDIATVGLAYIPNRFRKSSKLIKSWLKSKRAVYAAEGTIDAGGSVARVVGNRPDRGLNAGLMGGEAPVDEVSLWNSLQSLLGETQWLPKTKLHRESSLASWTPLGGGKKRYIAAEMATGQKLTDKIPGRQPVASDAGKALERDWIKQGRIDYEAIVKDIPILDTKRPLSVIHHSAPLKQIAGSINGLKPEIALEAAQYIASQIKGQKLLGYQQKGIPLPAIKTLSEAGRKGKKSELHDKVHALIDSYIGSDNFLRTLQKDLFPGRGIDTLEVWERRAVYDKIAEAINDADEAIAVFYRNVKARGNLKDVDLNSWISSQLETAIYDVKFAGLPTGRGLTDIINDIIGRSNTALENLVVRTSAKNLNFTDPMYKVMMQERGMEALIEAIKQSTKLKPVSSGSIYKQYQITVGRANAVSKKTFEKAIEAGKSMTPEQYQMMLRSRNKNIPPVDSTWNLGQDN